MSQTHLICESIRQRSLHREGWSKAIEDGVFIREFLKMLTPFERKLLLDILEGYTYKEIAGRRGIAHATVQWHAMKLMRRVSSINGVGKPYSRAKSAIAETLAARTPAQSLTSVL